MLILVWQSMDDWQLAQGKHWQSTLALVVQAVAAT
jgi:hypothetical protein